jgi:hypothetical protein
MIGQKSKSVLNFCVGDLVGIEVFFEFVFRPSTQRGFDLQKNLVPYFNGSGKNMCRIRVQSDRYSYTVQPEVSYTVGDYSCQKSIEIDPVVPRVAFFRSLASVSGNSALKRLATLAFTLVMDPGVGTDSLVLRFSTHVSPEGFEPPTFELSARCSTRLS